jgi:hypothetical protein
MAVDCLWSTFSSEMSCSQELTRLRDNFRDFLSRQDPIAFPRTGRAGAAVTDILGLTIPESARKVTLLSLTEILASDSFTVAISS